VQDLVTQLPNKGSESFSVRRVARDALAIIFRVVPTGGSQVFAFTEAGEHAPLASKPIIREQQVKDKDISVKKTSFFT
jgi:hypothetical protein